MKKTVLGLFAAALMAACNKTKPMTPSSAPLAATGNAPVTAAKQFGGGPKAYLVHMNMAGSSKGWCGGDPLNCVTIDPDIVIHVMKTAIDNAAGSNDPQQVKAVFSSSAFKTLNADYLGADLTAELQSGDYYLKLTNDDGYTASYMAGTDYPVTFSNMEFAFQFPYQ